MSPVIYWNTFLNSIKLPSKDAMFKLNRTGMDTALIYMFCLIFLVSIPEFVNRITGSEELYTNTLFFAIYFFIFYYLPFVIMMLFALSIVAYAYTKFAEAMERRLRFQIIWKLTAYATTIPMLIFTMTQFIISLNFFAMTITFIWTSILVIIMILHFPKFKPRQVKSSNRSAIK